MSSFRIVLVLALVALAALWLPGGAVATHDESQGEDAIEVCCAWNTALGDGILTYSIHGGTADLLEAARVGVEKWDTELGSDVTLNLVAGNEQADVTIKLSRGGSPFVAGQTNRKFQLIRDGTFFFAMKGATISIFGAAPGSEADVEETAAHEFGHALGAGHANDGGYLMSPSLVQIPSSTPTACDIAAVEAANEWFFDSASSPAPPSDDHVAC